MKQENKKYLIKSITFILIVIGIIIIINSFFPSDGNILILDNVQVTYFNQTNMSFGAIWAEGDTLYTIRKNKDNQLIIEKGEECNKELMDSKGNCIKYWNNLNEGDVVLVVIQSKESLSEIPNYRDGDIIEKDICINLPENLVIHKTGCPGCLVALPILEEIQNESNLSIKYINVANKEDRDYLLNYLKINTRYVPALISNCKVYIGALKKEEYKTILG